MYQIRIMSDINRPIRELILLTLAVKVKCQGDDDITSCLDAFSASGVQALQWKKFLGKKVKVTANDLKPEAVAGINENCQLNGCDFQDYPETIQSEAVIETSCKNANLLLHERSFQCIHLDPFGSSVNFLDAAFSNLPKDGILSVTSTDVSAFLGKCPQVTMRHYNGHVIKCEYQPELACRLILASLARAAARCHKGLEVLFAFAKEHFILTAVRVRRGYKKADESLSQVRRLLHCNLCEERTFLKESLLAEDNLYKNLDCSCYKAHPGKTASLLGPVWSGSIFSQVFVDDMKTFSAEIPGISQEVRSILEKMSEESRIGNQSSCNPDTDGKLQTLGKRKIDLDGENDRKTRKQDSETADGGSTIPSADQKLEEKITEGGSRGNAKDGKEERNNVWKPERTNITVTENISGTSVIGRGVMAETYSCSDKEKIKVADTLTGVENKKPSVNKLKEEAKEKRDDNSKNDSSAQAMHTPFYFTVVKHCPNKGKWPRMKTVLDILKAKGHQAALTIFHHHGVRTTASLQQYMQALQECSDS
ncbi:TRMT1-like protein isoform X2 [Apostichopus japonicus]|uniref:TRMT1-like protein isoform X2 n=1 Tax=Stichopus japonicus TaxID=307972 RepID=UPI003AB1CAAD